MTTVEYTCTANVVSGPNAPLPPTGFDIAKLPLSQIADFVTQLNGHKETITGATQTDRMRKLGVALAAYLAGLSGYTGPTSVIVTNSKLTTSGDWDMTSDNVILARSGTGTPVVLCASQAGDGTWSWAEVVAPEP